MTLLKIALTKGRTEKQVIPLLEKSGVDCSGLLNKKRRLIVSVADKYQFVLAKGPDVMTYLTNGACDIGIVGSDILEEQGRTENQLLDLNVGKCRFILASTSSFDPKEERRKMIGTKYPNITQRYFESIGEDVEIVKIEGSVELAPLVGLADAIVDLTETGTTLNVCAVKRHRHRAIARLIDTVRGRISARQRLIAVFHRHILCDIGTVGHASEIDRVDPLGQGVSDGEDLDLRG